MSFLDRAPRWINYYKFFIGKRLFHKSFKKNGLPLLKGRILDLGSGLGPFQDYLSVQTVVAMDYTLKGKPTLLGSAMALPFKGKTFDGVICTEVLEHLPEPERCLAEISRILKEDGIVYITAPMTWYLHYEPHDYYRFTNYGLLYLLRKHNFEPITIERLGGLYSFIFMRFLETFFVYSQKFFSLFLPKKYRFILVIPFTLPFSWFFYLAAAVLDKTNSKDAFGWCAVGRLSVRNEKNGHPVLVTDGKEEGARDAGVKRRACEGEDRFIEEI